VYERSGGKVKENKLQVDHARNLHEDAEGQGLLTKALARLSRTFA
jgi:hypothetical protein